MANEPILTVVGNLTGAPELKFLPSGKAVANFTVAQTPRVKGQNGEWGDGETTFYRAAAWEKLAEHVAESLDKGTRVIVQGALSTRRYEHNGEKRESLELRVDFIGPDLTYATAKVTRSQKGSGGGSPAPASNDAWGAPPASSGGGWGQLGVTPEPPY